MKKTLPLILACFTVICVIGQTVNKKTQYNSLKIQQGIENAMNINNNHKTLKFNPLKSISVEKHKLDSIIRETWDTASMQWVIYNKAIFTYDANGNNTSEIDYEWDQETNSLYTSYKDEFSYNSNKEITTQTSWEWDPDSGKLLYINKLEIFYDHNGNDTLHYLSDWDNVTNKWVPGYKERVIYDINGKVTTSVCYSLNEISSEWDTSSMKKYFYDANGNDSLSISYHIDNVSSQLAAYGKNVSAFDINGNDTLNIWHIWNDAESLFEPSYKYEKTYDANGNNILRFDYKWNETDSLWEPVNKSENTFDNLYTHDDLFLPVHYNSNAFFGHMLTRAMIYNYVNNNWASSDRSTAYYSAADITNIITNCISNNPIVFPNPTSDFVTIKIDETKSIFYVEVYDLHGRKIMDVEVENGIPFSVQDLNNGVYFYRINSSDNIQTGKLIIKK